MTGLRLPALLAALSMATPALAEPPLPPGLASAQLLPGWVDGGGNRIAALELQLEPGWKTYWRSPGDSGLPPSFAWEGSENLADVTFHWPAPEAIRSGDSIEMGYHDRLILPFTARPRDPAAPITLSAQVDLGLCEKICVPAQLDLGAAPAADLPDARIEAALAAAPRPVGLRPACEVTEISDGLRVRMSWPRTGVQLAAIELDGRPEIWVSGAEISESGGGTEAVAEMVGPSGQPFPLDPEHLRLTVIAADGATEMRGCAPLS